MAIDTDRKRFSIMNVMCPWRQTVPLPDGSINQGDRQQLLLAYSGIAWGAPAGTTIPVIVHHLRQQGIA